MIARWACLCWSLPVGLLSAAMAHCGPRVVDAVDLGQTSDGGPLLIWPTPSHSANSDPWLVSHHDDLVEMQPRVIVLDFYNDLDVQQAQQKVMATIDAISASSRYHGYDDPTAFAFLNYTVVKLVDLTDHPPPANYTYESSTLLPVDMSGNFDASALYAPAFAVYYGFPDPTNPSQYLTLCQLFEQGIVNELWLMTGDEGTPRRPPLMAEKKQVYDAQNKAVPGMFADTGYQPFPALQCGVTARMAYISPLVGVDCDLVAPSSGIENTASASPQVIPYLSDNATDFFNEDFTTRDGVTFNSWADLVAQGANEDDGWCTSQTMPCISYPSETAVPAVVPVATGTFPDAASWTMNPFVQGCGTAHFPPNARFEWDYGNTQAVRARCEHYDMHDAPSGDVLVGYSSTMAAVAALTTQFGDDGCGGGWQLYYRQSMPGLHNLSRAADGSPMKNWWPFLFY
jgi:hypothetical protein